jgi:D-alanine transaminase
VIVHLQGRLLPLAQAHISPLDRGFLMGDAIYEGLRAFRGRIVGLEAHMARMTRSLTEARIPWDPRQLGPLSEQLLAANDLRDAFVYWQITRGTPTPEMPVRTRMPPDGLTPTVFAYTSPQPSLESFVTPKELHAAIRPDLRWHRGHVKSTSLMGNVISCVESAELGASDAILVRDLDRLGEQALVAEGSATNLIAALPSPSDTRGFEIVTPDLESTSILAGVTRRLLLESGSGILARPISLGELRRAREVMIVGSNTMVASIVSLDGRPVGEGRTGPIAAKLLGRLVSAIARDLGFEPLSPAMIEPTPALQRAS